MVESCLLFITYYFSTISVFRQEDSAFCGCFRFFPPTYDALFSKFKIFRYVLIFLSQMKNSSKIRNFNIVFGVILHNFSKFYQNSLREVIFQIDEFCLFWYQHSFSNGLLKLMFLAGGAPLANSRRHCCLRKHVFSMQISILRLPKLVNACKQNENDNFVLLSVH